MIRANALLLKIDQTRAELNLKCFEVISNRVSSRLVPKLKAKILKIINDSCTRFEPNSYQRALDALKMTSSDSDIVKLISDNYKSQVALQIKLSLLRY